jgi:hypothetical protein
MAFEPPGLQPAEAFTFDFELSDCRTREAGESIKPGWSEAEPQVILAIEFKPAERVTD